MRLAFILKIQNCTWINGLELAWVLILIFKNKQHSNFI